MNTIEQKFQEIFIRDIGSLPPNLQTQRQNIPAWDSLRHAELIIHLQREFDFRFSMQEMALADTYTRLLEIVLAKAKPRA